MVVIRPVVGVRNPVNFTFPPSYLRAKNCDATDPGNRHLILATTSEPSPAAGGGATILNEKKY
jgi:hypothetical protein